MKYEVYIINPAYYPILHIYHYTIVNSRLHFIQNYVHRMTAESEFNVLTYNLSVLGYQPQPKMPRSHTNLLYEISVLIS